MKAEKLILRSNKALGYKDWIQVKIGIVKINVIYLHY